MRRRQIQEPDNFWEASIALSQPVWVPAVQLEDAGLLVSEGLADVQNIFRRKNGK